MRLTVRYFHYSSKQTGMSFKYYVWIKPLTTAAHPWKMLSKLQGYTSYRQFCKNQHPEQKELEKKPQNASVRSQWRGSVSAADLETFSPLFTFLCFLGIFFFFNVCVLTRNGEKKLFLKKSQHEWIPQTEYWAKEAGCNVDTLVPFTQNAERGEGNTQGRGEASGWGVGDMTTQSSEMGPVPLSSPSPPSFLLSVVFHIFSDLCVSGHRNSQQSTLEHFYPLRRNPVPFGCHPPSPALSKLPSLWVSLLRTLCVNRIIYSRLQHSAFKAHVFFLN